MTTPALFTLRRLSEYRQSRAHVFRSTGSITWFVRQNRRRLIDAGALVLLNGSWHANESSFDAVVLEVAQEAAKRLAENA